AEESSCLPPFQRDAADQAIGELSCAVRLACARRPVEHDLLLVEQQIEVACTVGPIRAGVPNISQGRPVEVQHRTVRLSLQLDKLLPDQQQLLIEILGNVLAGQQLGRERIHDVLLVRPAGHRLELAGTQQVQQY